MVCNDGTVIASLPQVKIHSSYLKELIGEWELVCRCTATTIILTDISVVNLHAALEILSDIGVVTVPSEWRDIVTPCYTLLRIPWMEEEGDQVYIQVM